MKHKQEILNIFFMILVLIFMFVFMMWTMITLFSIVNCDSYNQEGYITLLYWEKIILVCDVALEYNDGEIVYVNAGSIGNTFVIENYGVRK